jgi:hypothetical protein
MLLLSACGSVPLNEDGEFDPRSTQSFALDNDTFADSDDDYTNRLQYSWLSPYLDSYEEAPIPSAIGRWLDEWQIFNRAEEQQHFFFSYSFSHRIFTPSDLTLEHPVDGADVPYSALMYLTATAGAQDESTMDAVSATIGWVGPAALGEQIQNGWHDLISSKDAEGWDTQVGNEPLFNLAYERRWGLSRFGHRGWGGDWLASGAGSVGNLLSMATAGTSVRFGWNVLDDYAMPPPFASEESIGSRPLTRTGMPQWSIYGFLYVNGSVIANATSGTATPSATARAWTTTRSPYGPTPASSCAAAGSAWLSRSSAPPCPGKTRRTRRPSATGAWASPGLCRAGRRRGASSKSRAPLSQTIP